MEKKINPLHLIYTSFLLLFTHAQILCPTSPSSFVYPQAAKQAPRQETHGQGKNWYRQGRKTRSRKKANCAPSSTPPYLPPTKAPPVILQLEDRIPRALR
jgi:hypothetical protein